MSIDTFTNKRGVIIYTGDVVADPMDNDCQREIESITDNEDGTACLMMTDGGCVGSDEVTWDNLNTPA